MLVRRYIGKKLAEYYAQPSHKVVGRSLELEASNASSNEGILSSSLGEWHWKRVFQRFYENREGHWLTPVELFQPHYSYIVGNFCANYHERIQNLGDAAHLSSFEIVELGGGRGTNASWVLAYLKEQKPQVYASLRSYTLVDSSPSLHQAQIDRFKDGPHAEKVRFEHKDLSDVAEGITPLFSKSDVPTVLMGMEVLDNLPHDKVRGRTRHSLKQAEVIASKQGVANSRKRRREPLSHLEEHFVSVNDPLLQRILRKLPSYYTQQKHRFETDAVWIPTVACGVLQHAIYQRPNLGLLLADFDWLPPPDLEFESFFQSDENNSSRKVLQSETPAHGSPIVTDMKGKDHESYLNAPAHCDILFPTDFDKLASFVRRCLPNSQNGTGKSVAHSTMVVQVNKQSEFLQQWGPEHVDNTKSWVTGHTPLLHDFSNCSVLTMFPK